MGSKRLSTFAFVVAAALAVLASSPALATVAPTRPERFSIFYGYGVGSFASGGPSRPNSTQMGGLSLSLLGDRLRLRAWKGSFERTDLPIPQDNDADFNGAYGVLVTRRWTKLPFDLGLAAAHHEQHVPDPRTGERILIESWGPVLSVARDVDFGRFLAAFGELDVHYVPFDEKPKETQAVFELGLRVRL
jgi:hypothetical protein